MLPLQPVQPSDLVRPAQLRLGGLREREEERGVCAANGVRFPALLQLVACVLPHRFEHPVACFAVRVLLYGHQRLLHQPPDEIQHVFRLAWEPGAHGLSRLQGEAPGEDRQAPVQDLLPCRK